MKIAVPCPESIRLNMTTEDANNHPVEGVTLTIEGGLISFEFSGSSLDERIESLTDLDHYLGLAIADEDREDQIVALSAIKTIVGQVERHVVHETAYTSASVETAADTVAEATDDTVISHSHASQNTSSEGSSEQHGVVLDLNEEILNEQAHEEEPAADDHD